MKKESHDLRGGRLHLHRREGSRFWQCSASFGGQRMRESTQEESLEKAKDFAEDWYDRLYSRHKKGLLKHGGKEGTFAEAAEGFIYEYTTQNKGERSDKWVRSHEIKLRIHLLPFFGKMLVEDITAGTAQDYRNFRMTPQGEKNPLAKDNRPHTEKLPARNTIHNEIVTLRMVLKWAERHRWIKYVPNVAPAYRKPGKVTPRAWFSPAQYKQLYGATRENAKNARPQDKWAAEQLHDYVLFMANTGLRPDEANNLQHRDVEIVEDEDTDETILLIEVRGKRGFGYCKSTAGAVKPYLRLKSRPKPRNEDSPDTGEILPGPSDHVFPSDHKKQFNAILEREGLKTGRDEQSRTAYSLRHTYICLRLMEGADIYQIAKNCRTSVEMIERFYASHISTTLDASQINVRRLKSSASSISNYRAEDDE